MRKIIKSVVVAVTTCILSGSIVFGAEVDLGAMGLEDLIALRAEITKEIEARVNSDSETIDQGVYLTGRDITTGNYVSTAGDDYVDVGVLRDMKALEEQDESALLSEMYLSPGESGSIYLENGNVLMIREAMAFIRENKASWMPAETAEESVTEAETE